MDIAICRSFYLLMSTYRSKKYFEKTVVQSKQYEVSFIFKKKNEKRKPIDIDTHKNFFDIFEFIIVSRRRNNI